MRKYFIILLIVSLSSSFMPTPDESGKYARSLIVIMVSEVGDINDLKSLKDVEYVLTYRDNSTGREDVSVERYIFDGELSYGKYKKHELYVLPDKNGKVVQGYNGRESWVTLDGTLMDDPEALKLADFTRKTNIYWFCMMPKLLDPGVNYSYEGKRKVDGIDYELVMITFGDDVGDTSDKYLLYINPETHLVDQFLFTVMAFDIKDPYLMKVEYEEVSGINLPVRKKLTKSNWKGEILEETWTEETMTDIKFNNGFNKSDFNKPL